MSIRIPKSRIGVLIGKNGQVKEQIEKITETNIKIDSKTGFILIQKKQDENLNIGDWIAKNMIKAIGRGFNPKIAIKLLDDDMLLEIIDLEKVIGGSKRNIYRIKSRLIGDSGKTRKTIETMAGVNVSIYGNTISIIGEYEELKVAREAIFKLIRGQSHSTVYRFLQKKRDELKQKNFTQLWKPR
ncbi:MAG: KH domain-containing protein [Promethearchaeota archaeon]